jgi:hypothetical protein
MRAVSRFRQVSLAGRLTAIGFALGGTIHATAWVLLLFGVELYRPGYPPWRHVLFALIDASIASIAVLRPGWLVFALVAFLADQLWEHGVEPAAALVTLAALAAGLERCRGSATIATPP